MELLLTADVEKLGKKGDVVKVSSGYARNFLLPRKLAVAATDENRRQLDLGAMREARKREAELKNLKAMADQIAATSCTIARKAQDGHLFGSVTAADIASAFSQENFPLGEKNVDLEAPIKELGVYVVKVRLSIDVETRTKVWVVAE